MKLANIMLDIFDDLGLETFKKVATRTPSHLRCLPLMTFEERCKLDDSDFALQIITKEAGVLSKFPIHDELNTWLSNEYFNELAHNLPFSAQKIAASNIMQACQKQGIIPTKSIEKLAESQSMPNVYLEGQHESYDQLLKEAATEITKTPHIAESTFFYALPQLKKYAMPNQQYVSRAAQYFDKYASYFDANERREYAVQVQERAKELAVDISRFTKVAHYAANSYNSALPTHIQSRMNLLSDKPVYKDALAKMAAQIDKYDAVTFARALYEFDKTAGLTRFYDKDLADAFFSSLGLAKQAAGELEIEGLIVKSAQITKMSDKHYKKLKQCFGETLAGHIKKGGLASVESLPKLAQETVARIVNGHI